MALISTKWRKSTYSGGNGGNCVEVGTQDERVLVRDTTDRDGVVLSGETPHPELVERWARIRAGAPAGAPVQLFRIEDVRMIEPASPHASP